MTSKKDLPARPRSPTRRPHALVWTSRALSDLDSIGDHIAQDNPGAATSWVSRLIAAAGKAKSTPFAGRRVPELGREDIREVLLRNHRIVYLVAAHSVEILTVFEGHRVFPKEVNRPPRKP